MERGNRGSKQNDRMKESEFRLAASPPRSLHVTLLHFSGTRGTRKEMTG